MAHLPNLCVAPREILYQNIEGIDERQQAVSLRHAAQYPAVSLSNEDNPAWPPPGNIRASRPASSLVRSEQDKLFNPL